MYIEGPRAGHAVDEHLVLLVVGDAARQVARGRGRRRLRRYVVGICPPPDGWIYSILPSARTPKIQGVLFDSTQVPRVCMKSSSFDLTGDLLVSEGGFSTWKTREGRKDQKDQSSSFDRLCPL